MAHKTKKQKILADQRRELAISYSYAPSSHSSKQAVDKPSPQIESDLAFVKKDLVKIGYLSAIAICAQVVLWYLLEKGLVKLF